MSITVKTTKMLWGLAAARCSMPECRKFLVLDETETDAPATVGEMAHIVGESAEGPRGQAVLTREERDRYSNLILLCGDHHTEIDQQPEAWPVAKLQEIKSAHEAWVRTALPPPNESERRDDLQYAEYIDQWARLSHLAEWSDWTSSLLSNGQPSLRKEILSDLNDLLSWLIKRVWPGRHQKLEEAFQNFWLVLRDLLAIFGEHSEEWGADSDRLWTRKFYKISEYNEQRYFSLLNEYEAHVVLVEELTLETTRAANLICSAVRSSVLHSYWMKEGLLSVITGPFAPDLSWREWVVQYSSHEASTGRPYPGLDEFKKRLTK